MRDGLPGLTWKNSAITQLSKWETKPLFIGHLQTISVRLLNVGLCWSRRSVRWAGRIQTSRCRNAIRMHLGIENGSQVKQHKKRNSALNPVFTASASTWWSPRSKLSYEPDLLYSLKYLHHTHSIPIYFFKSWYLRPFIFESKWPKS